VRVFHAETGKPAWSTSNHANEILSLSFSPNSGSLAVASADGTVKICAAQSGDVAKTFTDHAGGATSVAFSPDGKSLNCGEAFGGARVWEVSSGRPLQSFKSPAGAESFARERAVYADNPDRLMNAISLSNSGATLAVCGSSINNEFVDAVRLWNPRTGEMTRDFTAEKIHGRPMALSPDGTILATGGKSVQLWEARTGKKLHQLFGHLKRTQSIVFSADGKTLVAGGSWGTTNIWDVATGKHLVTLFAFRESGDKATTDHWLAYHPEGYYAGSPGVERYLAWRVGEELLTPATLSAELNRPELLKLAP
jgi:WD40 repeat protein